MARDIVTVFTVGGHHFEIDIEANEQAGYIGEPETSGESIAEVEKAIGQGNALIDIDAGLVLIHQAEAYRFSTKVH